MFSMKSKVFGKMHCADPRRDDIDSPEVNFRLPSYRQIVTMAKSIQRGNAADVKLLGCQSLQTENHAVRIDRRSGPRKNAAPEGAEPGTLHVLAYELPGEALGL